MFELDTAIEDWKQSFVEEDAIGQEQLQELEAHLREMTDDLGNTGLSPREAFLVGTDRLGHPSQLQHEYAKVANGAQWQRRLFWMLTGYIAMSVSGSAIAAISAITTTGLAVAGVGGAASGAAAIATAACLWSVLLLLGYRHLANRQERIPRGWLTAIAILFVASPALSFGAGIARMRLVDTTWLGDSAMILNFGGLAIHLCVIAVCFVAMCKLNTRTLTPAND